MSRPLPARDGSPKRLLHLPDERGQVTPDVHLERLAAAGAIPHDQRDRAGSLAVDEDLLRRGHERVGDLGRRERHALDRAIDVQHGRTADQQIDLGRRRRRRHARTGRERRLLRLRLG
jgi:hypothetical protein